MAPTPTDGPSICVHVYSPAIGKYILFVVVPGVTRCTLGSLLSSGGGIAQRTGNRTLERVTGRISVRVHRNRDSVFRGFLIVASAWTGDTGWVDASACSEFMTLADHVLWTSGNDQCRYHLDDGSSIFSRYGQIPRLTKHATY